MNFCIFDTTVAMMLAWRLKHFSYTEISLLLGVRFSSTKFAQRKNLAKASWQKLFNLVVIRLKCWLWRVFHSVDPLTSKIWFVNLSSIDLIFCIFDTTVTMMLAWRLKHFSYGEQFGTRCSIYFYKICAAKTSGKSFMIKTVQLSRY